ncbi:MAG: M15 family metallopeptidase [Pseudomonadota bacterium]
MSAQLFKSDILFLQRLLSVGGFYAGPRDGKWSAAVDAAEDAFIARTEAIRAEHGRVDPRSEAAIATLTPEAQVAARRFMAAAREMPLTCRILSGTRTYAEQDTLYAIGRTRERNRKPVTRARGGQSNHNFGVAWDVGLFEGGTYYAGATRAQMDAYRALAARAKAAVPDLAWGGDWKSFPDAPHYELKTGKTVAQLRALLEAGKPYR